MIRLYLYGVMIVGAALLQSIDAGVSWKIGVAKVNITPDQFFWMSGYAARTKPAEGKLTDLWAKVLVLEDQQGERACLVTLDLIGVHRRFSQLVCREIRARYQLDRKQVAICCSHTHTGPVVGGNLSPLHYLQLDDDQRKRVDRYAGILRANILDAVHQAINNLQSSSLWWGNGSTDFAVNRRENRPEQNVKALRVTRQLKGPTDHDVPVLAVRDQAGKLKAVVFGYACHATVLSSYEWSGDYPGFAQMELESYHPDCIAMFWAGCGGDQNPIPRRDAQLARHYGRRLANAVDKVLLTTQMHELKSRLVTKFDEIDLAFQHVPNEEELRIDIKSDNRYMAARARFFMSQLDSGEEIPRSYPYPVGSWHLGDEIQFVLLGGEVVVDYANRIKSQHRKARTWVAGYTNDVMAYIPSRRVLREGGYEGGGAMVYYGLPSAWAPDVEADIMQEVARQLSPNDP